MLVENSEYTMSAVSRDATGEYKCSLVEDETMEASQNIFVSCKYVPGGIGTLTGTFKKNAAQRFGAVPGGGVRP